ncbi:hypothetical protein [Priestia megaterium]|uniref:hypothetical protein n=1 Tax=Priestia megaterium TaxID=1404 RepID=UPI0034583E22
MAKKNTEIAPHPEWKNNIHYEKPKAPKNTKQATLAGISNAYDAEAYLDQEGKLWISEGVLHTLLRTSVNSARFIVESFETEHKVELNGKTFVRGYMINAQITKEIEKSGLQPKGNYLRFSEACLMAIRDSDTAKALRGTYEELWKIEKKKMKNRRLKQMNVNHDELTGEVLFKRTAEFSHIRSVDRFKELALHIENGLIVNKETHAEITKAGLNDEIELEYFCIKKGWKTDWVEEYKGYLEGNNY